MRLVLTFLGVAAAATAASAHGSPVRPILTARCSDSTYQWPAREPVAAAQPLRVGPVRFQNWQPNDGVLRSPGVVLRPTNREPYYKVVSWFDIDATAANGVIVKVDPPATLVWQGTHASTGLTFVRAIAFPLCRDTETMRLEGTQYGLSVELPKPGCFTIAVRRRGARVAARATIRVLRPRC